MRTQEYEAKIAGLLERTYKTDVAADDEAVRQYREAHAVLSRVAT